MSEAQDKESYTRRRVEMSPLSFVINHISHGSIGNAVNQLPKEQICTLRENRTGRGVEDSE